MFFKLVTLFALVAVCAAAPAPAPGAVLAYHAPALVSSVVSPAVTSYSSYSHGVVHGSPVVSLPVVHSPVVHTVPLTYAKVVQPVLL